MKKLEWVGSIKIRIGASLVEIYPMVSGRVCVVVLIIVTVLPITSSVSGGPDRPSAALPGCDEYCGDFEIPYPFGVGVDCSHNSWFIIECDSWSNPQHPVPYLSNLKWSHLSLIKQPFTPPSPPPSPPYLLPPPPSYKPPPPDGSRVMNISLGSRSLLVTGSFDHLTVSGESLHAIKNLTLTQSPYLLAGARNALIVGGCSGGQVLALDHHNNTVAGCATVCVHESAPNDGSFLGGCYGLGCCQSVFPTPLEFLQVVFLNLLNHHTRVDTVVSAAVVDISYLVNRTVDKGLTQFQDAPSLLQWRLDDLQITSPAYANSSCAKATDDGAYSCSCKHEYFHGNPYLPNGCRAIKECRKCPDDCFPVNGMFRCPSPLPPPLSSTKGTGSKFTIVLGLGISLASVFMLITIFGLYKFLKKRKEVTQKKDNFKRNGGLLLQQQLHSGDYFIERTHVFTSIELEKATDSFNRNRVLGQGGQGTVYKGMLVDGAIVAIKKSKKVNERQLEQFINEVVVLSQVNHRNVMKLFGCCLETDVPLLVYEYVPNGTLYQHIHNPTEDFRITWNMRLQIAMESAEALAYLHSWSISPIFHRDIKTSNILLDGKYKAKISDFGTSKTLAIDQTHVTTSVQGTFGYIDPEFFQSSQFTEKSDVYSFGIVLLELLTSKKPVYLDESGEAKSLVSDFLFFMRSSHLHDVVDPKNLEEARDQEIEGVADLARRCLSLSGNERPTMKEVVMSLQMISSSNGAHNNTSQQDLIPRDKIIVDQIYTNSGGSLNFSSTYGPR